MQRGLRAIRDDLGVPTIIAFENAKDDGFSVSTPNFIPFNSVNPEERLVNLDLHCERGSGFAELGKSHANGSEIGS